MLAIRWPAMQLAAALLTCCSSPVADHLAGRHKLARPPEIIDFPMFVNVIGGKMTFPHLLTYLLLFLYVIELPFLEWDQFHLCAKLQGVRTL